MQLIENTSYSHSLDLCMYKFDQPKHALHQKNLYKFSILQKLQLFSKLILIIPLFKNQQCNFNAILNGDNTNNSANDMIRPSRPNTLDNATAVGPPDREDVPIAIQRLKCNKARGYDGRSAELFKAELDELVSCMYHLLCSIWSLDSMTNDWSLSLLCPVLKKGDTTICSYYHDCIQNPAQRSV